MSFFLKKILHLKEGGGCGFNYLLFLNFHYYLYSFVTFLNSGGGGGGGGAWVLFFSLF
jgi:hypothetical protein